MSALTTSPCSFGQAWLANDEVARQMMPEDARKSSWQNQVQKWTDKGIDPLLVRVISRQAQRWKAPEEAQNMIEKLKSPRVVTVVTGQQCGFLLGPCYTLYKAISAIQWAALYEKSTGRPTVPIFWLQSEDHDDREIATAHVLDGNQVVPLTMPMDGQDRCSVAHRTLTSDLSSTLDALEQIWSPQPFGSEVMHTVRETWSSGRRVIDAFAESIYRLLGKLGLVIIDPRDPELSALARPVHEQSIFESISIEATLNARSEQLTQSGFKVQIPPRTDGTLSFFHPDGPSGPRYRIMRRGDHFQLSGRQRSLSASEIRDALTTSPECFSTSALLRPLLQECWLPTVATVVGPGELSYFGQLSPLFELLDYRPPGVIPRAHARMWTLSWHRAYRKGHFTEADLSETRDEVLTRLGQAYIDSASTQLREEALELPLKALDQFIAESKKLDKGIVPYAERTRRTLEKSMTSLLNRHARNVALRSEQQTDRLDQLRAGLAPFRAPQERVLTPLHFATLYGEERLIEALYRSLTPDRSGQLTEIELW